METSLSLKRENSGQHVLVCSVIISYLCKEKKIKMKFAWITTKADVFLSINYNAQWQFIMHRTIAVDFPGTATTHNGLN